MALLKSSAKKRAGATTPPPSKPTPKWEYWVNKLRMGFIFLGATVLVTIMLNILFFGEGQTVLKSAWYWLALFGGITLGATYIAQNKRDISILTKVSWVVIIVSLGLCLIKGLNPELNPREKIQELVQYLQTEDIYGGPIEIYEEGVYHFPLDSGEVLDHYISFPTNTGIYEYNVGSATNRFEMLFLNSKGEVEIAKTWELAENGGSFPHYKVFRAKIKSLEKQVVVLTVTKSS